MFPVLQTMLGNREDTAPCGEAETQARTVENADHVDQRLQEMEGGNA